MNIEQINKLLNRYQVEVTFTKEALADLNSYDKHQQEKIIALIIRRGITGPLLKPHGIGEPLRDKLKRFTKIKPKNMALRIVYRPVIKGTVVRMEIIAIGPRDKKKVYLMAAKRLQLSEKNH